MVRWHHWCDGHESEWTPGVGDGQGGLACCDSWGRKESDMTEWTEDKMVIIVSHILKAYIVKAMVFPLAMYRCKSWTIKKAEHERTDAFKLYCWRRFLRVPWTARRSNQLILKEISSEYSLEGLILKFQYLGHLMQKANSLEKTLMLEKIKGRRRGLQRMRLHRTTMALSTQWTWVWANFRR